MGQSILGMHRRMQKQQPHYKAMKKLANWYEDHKITPHAIAEKIKIIHNHFDRAQRILDTKHAGEVRELRLEQIALQERAKKLGAKHLHEKEDLTLGYCTVELDLLQGKISELPEEFKPVHQEPNWIVKLLSKISTA